MARYDAGETLASIARTYDCSPPAISYVVSRSRARSGPAPQAAGSSAAEPQLIKAVAPDEPAAANGRTEEVGSPPSAGDHGGADALRQLATNGNGAATPEFATPEFATPEFASRAETSRREQQQAPAGGGHPVSDHHLAPQRPDLAPQRPAAQPNSWLPPQQPAAQAPHANGDQRRTLHLSLDGSGHGNGSAAPFGSHNGAGSVTREPQSQAAAPWPGDGAMVQGGSPGGGSPGGGSPGGSPRPGADHNGAAERHHANGGPRPEGAGAFIDHELRARVEADIAVFLAAFDAALAQDSPESRSALREATDRLLRAGARTRIELERLEARVPLPRHGGGDQPAWRHR